MENGRTLGAVDMRPVIPTAVSLVREGNWDLSEFARPDGRDLLRNQRGRLPGLPGCFQTSGARIYSAFPQGMVPFAVAVTGLAHLWGTDLDDGLVHLRLEKVTAALVMALNLGAFFLTSARLGHPRAAAIATAYLATSSAMFTTVGLGLWRHGGVTLGLQIARLGEFRAAGRPSARGTLIQGLACALLLMCRPTAGPPRRGVRDLGALAVAFLGSARWNAVTDHAGDLWSWSRAPFFYLPC